MKDNILIINGSAQEPSLNEKYLSFIEKIVKSSDTYDIDTVSLRALGLPLFLGSESTHGKPVDKWRERVERADGFIVAVPEYHHSLPAVLKNSFDHLDNAKAFRDKPVMLIGATPSQFGTVQAQQSMYPILRTFGAWLVPDEIFVPRAEKDIDGSDVVTNDAVAKRIKDVTEKFLLSVAALRSLRK